MQKTLLESILGLLKILIASFNSLFLIPYSSVYSYQKEQRPVQMMFQEATFKLAYIKEVKTQVLEVPYVGEELSMIILLPDDNVDLSSVR